MKMKKQNYFNKRLEKMLNLDIKRSKAVQIRIKRGYKEAFQLIEDDIAKYVARISDDLILDARALKRKVPKEVLLARAKELKLEEETMANYENLSYAEAIRREMLKSLDEMAKKNESEIFKALFKTYENNYYSTSYLLYKTMDDFSFTKRVTKEYFDWMAKKPWTSDGKTFSDRIWKDQKTLADELYKEFTVAATRGSNMKEAARRMSRKMNVSYKRCLRLLNTEDSFFSNKAVMDAYNKTTADEYMIVGTLDRRTCEVCGSQDSKHYKIKDAKVGVNMPPFHPNCRCTTVVYFEDDEMPEERMMRDDKGKSVKTDYMNYEDWKKKYVDRVDNVDVKGYTIIKGIEKTKESKKEENSDKPKTLINFEEHTQEWEDNVVKKILPEEKIQVINDYIKKLIDENEFCMRRSERSIEKIAVDGKFKNQFETRTSGGTFDPRMRIEGANNLFGKGQELLKDAEREKYGYLGANDYMVDMEMARGAGAGQYGGCIIRFKKSALQNRTTFTVDDSLGPAVYKMLTAGDVNRPRANGINEKKLNEIYRIIRSKEANNLKEFVKGMRIRYFELQYHGDLTLDDVSEICFTKIPSLETINIFKKKGIKLFLKAVKGGKDVIEEI